MPPLFQVNNRQSEDSGRPPVIGESREWKSYFENVLGEQWICTYDAITDVIRIYSGDCGWGTPLTIRTMADAIQQMRTKANGDEQAHFALEMEKVMKQQGLGDTPCVCGDGGPVMLGIGEASWVTACWEVICELRK